MRIGEKTRKLLAFVLATAMLMSVAAGTLADDAYTGVIDVEDGKIYPEDLPEDVAVWDAENKCWVLKKDLEPAPSEYEGIDPALSVSSCDEELPSVVEVDGDVILTEERDEVFIRAALEAVSSDDGGIVDVHVTGDVVADATATEGTAYATAISAISGSHVKDGDKPSVDNTTTVTVDGEVIAKASAPEYEPDEGDDAPESGTTVYAVEAVAYGDGNSTTVTIGKGVEGTVNASSYDNGEITINILEGGITAEEDGAISVGSGWNNEEEGHGEPGGTVTIDVKGDVTSEEDTVVYTDNYNGTVKIEIDGNVTSPETTAIRLNNDGGTTEAEVTGSVSSEFPEYNVETQGDYEPAIETRNSEGTLELKVGGDVEAVNGPAVSLVDEDGETVFKAEGNVKGDSYAIQIQTSGDAKVEASVRKDVAAESEASDVVAIDIQAFSSYDDDPDQDADQSEVVVEVGCDVRARGTSDEDYQMVTGIRENVNDKKSKDDVTVKVGENVTVTNVEWDAVALQLEAKGEEMEVTVEIGGGIDVEAGTCATGIYAATGSGNNTIEVTVGRDVKVSSDERHLVYGTEESEEPDTLPDTIGILALNPQGHVTIGVDGNITATGGDATAIELISTGMEGDELEGHTEVTVGGDVTSSGTGLRADLMNGATADVLVEGTISGKDYSVVLADETKIGENLTLTVWEVKPNEDGNYFFVEEYDEDKGEWVAEANNQAGKETQYIIKIAEDDDTRKTIASLAGTTQYKGHDVAKEGDKVTLKLNVPQGYRLQDIYGDASQVIKLLVDASGNYYLEVPRGGGVMLSVKLEKLPEAKRQAKAEETSAEIAPARPWTARGANAALVEAENTTDTNAIMQRIQEAMQAGNFLTAFPIEIQKQIPPEYAKLSAMLTMMLVNYNKTMGSVPLTVRLDGKHENEDVYVIFAVQDGENTKYFLVKGVGQADGTVKIVPDAKILQELADKTFAVLAVTR